jgi:DNA-binding LacI/PurR family transcriptional regulator
VPGDVSVVGFGDHMGAAAYTPRLTTVRIPSQEAGERAARMIVGRIEDGSTGERDRAAPIEAVFNARETTGVAREPQGRPG